MKKKVYIISHSHWDREWYMPYEQHHMRLITLIDDLLEQFETNPDFNSFHLDGQTISLDDYLEVRPNKREALQKAITEGKLKIGPFYILQDDFLTSSESNTRNMLVGLEESRKWGAPVKLGYFPDTFGNMGQAPQMMLEGGLDVTAYGRGVKPTGFNNVVINDEKYTSQYSEMWWEGSDKSKVLGILFANWYSNGNEIPAEKEAAIKFWDTKLADAEQFASTNHLLMMNGCDHQPLQKDVTDAIKLANELYPDYEFLHSNFEDYINAVKADLPKDLNTVEGELTSQETDGWYTLANCSSSRIYLKQRNTEVSRQLENITEPLATMAAEITGEYPHGQLRYAWKLLMQNHPHDSICGCSVDEVHQEMMTRYLKSHEVGKFLANEALETLTNAIDTSKFPEGSKPFVVVNTTGQNKTGYVETMIEWKRKPFSEGSPGELFYSLKDEEKPSFNVVDENGNPVEVEVLDVETTFGYDLPKDAFRIPFMATYVKVRLHLDKMAGLSWKGFALIEGDAPKFNDLPIYDEASQTLENKVIKAVISEDGRLSITDKKNDVTYDNMLTFENVGDIANEYIFKQPKNDTPIFAHEYPYEIEVKTNNSLIAEIILKQTMMIPHAAEELLQEEMKAVLEMRQRNAGRSSELIPFVMETTITLEKNSEQLKFATYYNNQSENHRLRVLFPTGIETDKHYAESIFEVIERPNAVSSSWTNPTNPQHQHSFVNVQDENKGVTVSNFGINEYEILNDQNTIALTILRSTGELGDWGYFPTPEAQCIGENTIEFAVAFHTADDKFDSFKDGQAFQIPFSVKQTSIHEGELNTTQQFATIESDQFLMTALKRKEHEMDIVLRGFNLSNETSSSLSIEVPNYKGIRGTLIEEVSDKEFTNTLTPAEIHTTIWSK
ncbi:alpha-mannosidase [Vagococcus fluvialis]|uniref:alpha-mannosidase n=1 Tax=Vagococcus fluvialis TaxID=2738 RepID=UPI001D09FF56|nr:alpha-mannosidase [Vagococcus fluvialis]UDM71694.1 alpha-mannosidase [Vagococcus fluvialis]UDM76557.1 alpha-mannosidase [Vagococcus fluvialis]UDM83387.1 alpha-mannosidase [Vagococcus fluvialis]